MTPFSVSWCGHNGLTVLQFCCYVATHNLCIYMLLLRSMTTLEVKGHICLGDCGACHLIMVQIVLYRKLCYSAGTTYCLTLPQTRRPRIG